MSLNVTRVVVDKKGETHLATIELPTVEEPAGNGLARLIIPTTTATYLEYLEHFPDRDFHNAVQPVFLISLSGGFEVTTTSGESRLIRPGDWFLSDDFEGKGHNTRAAGKDPRINLAINIDRGWRLPGV